MSTNSGASSNCMPPTLPRPMSTKPILLNNIFPVENVGDYKIHFGKWNEVEEPLDAWIREESNWSGWQIYTKNRDDFNRQYIFSLMRFYHEIDIWLFGGIFEVKQENKKWIEDDDWKGYENDVELTDQCAEYIGRLKIYSPYRGRAVRLNFENYYGELEVHEFYRKNTADGFSPAMKMWICLFLN